MRDAYGKLPLSFEANQGQTDSQVEFLSRGNGYELFLLPTEAVFSISKPSKAKDVNGAFASRQAAADSGLATPTSIVRMKLLGANSKPLIEGLDELPGKSNYLIGNDPEKWRTNIPSYAKVKHKDIYPGVDMIYYGDQRQLEYDFVVAPGANPGIINLSFEGVKNARIDRHGDLVLRTAGGEIRQHKPVVYQEAGGTKRYLEGRYLLKGRHEVGFETATYDASKPLVIDPILIYSSYLGGTGDDLGHSIAVDDFGNAYVAGETSSIDFPTRNPSQAKHGGTTVGYTNAFITKINASGSALIYSTYLGGSLYDRAYAIAVDRVGASYITGSTSSTDFPTLNPIQAELRHDGTGGEDAFITKLNPSGSELVFSTYLGGGSFDDGYGIAVDAANNVYVTGVTGDWPTTIQAFQPHEAGHTDAFITKLDSTGTQILYSTYLGGRDTEYGLAIAVDSAQNAFITGYTESAFDFPTRNALQPTFGGGMSDAFVARIPTVPAPFVFPSDTFDSENGGSPASPYSNFSNWNVTSGSVNLENNPFTNGGLVADLDCTPQGATIETKSPLVLKAMTYRLRFDLSIRTTSSKVTVRLGNVFSETFTLESLGAQGLFASVVRDIQVPAQTSAKLSFEQAGGQGVGVFLDNVSVFERAGSEYITFLGGSGDESRLVGQLTGGIKVDAAGSAYVTGWTDSPNFPKLNAIQLTLGGGRDAFISKLNPAGSALVYSTYYGGAADDLGNDLGIDAAGDVFVVGSTRSSNFPTKNAIQPTFGGGDNVYGDAFAIKLSSTGGEVVYSTYLGGNRRDLAEGVAVDSAGDAFVTGYTTSTDFPLASPLQNQVVVWDAFVSKIPSVLGSGVPDVLSISPTSGGNTGIVTFRLSGENFGGLTANVRLVRAGANEIVPLSATIRGPALIVASFDLTGAIPGQWDVVVEFSDGRSKRIANAVTINAGGEPRIWADVIGPRTIRLGVKQQFTIVFGNSGDVDAFQVPGWIKAQTKLEPRLKETLAHPPDPGPSPVDWSKVPQQVETGKDSTTPILIPHLPAKSTRMISLEVTPRELSPFNIEVWANGPLITNVSSTGGASESAIDCLVKLATLAIDEALDKALPVDCVEKGATFAKKQLIDLSLRALRGEDNQNFSYTQFVYGLVSVAATCAIEFLPETKLLEIMVKVIEDAALGAEIGEVLSGCISAFIRIVSTANPNLITVVQSFDPNDKVGSIGTGSARYLTGAEPLRYVIDFENKKTASAPAQEVAITDQLDPALLDLSSFSFGPISFGSRRITPSGTDFTTDVDLRPERGVIARVNGKLDAVTGRLTWKFVSLDPATGLPTTDPLAGFLPPSVNPPEGDGNVFFTVSPKSNLPTGTVINNSASIVFDNNAAISTPTWSNTIDNSKPTSHVLTLPATQNSASFNVQWSGTDTGSGIGDYTIYVSDNGGPFTPWMTQTIATQATFASTANHTYSFFSVASDLTGNTEALKTTADATTRVLAVANIAGHVTDPYGNGVQDVKMALSGDRSATAQTDESGAASFADLPAGSYTVTPSKMNYTFAPQNKTFGSLSTNQTADFIARVTSGAPILISEQTSTRALALDSVLWLRDPFRLNSPVPWGGDTRTRVMLFIMNFDFQTGEDKSIVTAEAEDAAHRLYPLTVEYVGRAPGSFWLNSVIIRLNDDMGDLGDVLVRVNVRGVSSNRVRLGIGHNGGGPPDDLGAVPTPGRRP